MAHRQHVNHAPHLDQIHPHDVTRLRMHVTVRGAARSTQFHMTGTRNRVREERDKFRSPSRAHCRFPEFKIQFRFIDSAVDIPVVPRRADVPESSEDSGSAAHRQSWRQSPAVTHRQDLAVGRLQETVLAPQAQLIDGTMNISVVQQSQSSPQCKLPRKRLRRRLWRYRRCSSRVRRCRYPWRSHRSSTSAGSWRFPWRHNAGSFERIMSSTQGLHSGETVGVPVAMRERFTDGAYSSLCA